MEHSGKDKVIKSSMKPSSKTNQPSQPLPPTSKPKTILQSLPADEFVIRLKYSNNLPNAPSGPYLKAIPYIHYGSYSSLFDNQFPEYHTSTLEKGYTWQPHFGADLGIQLDLVDPEAILASEAGNPSLDQSDLKYLTGSVDTGRSKLAQLDQQSKPMWLRNTTYMENNLFNRSKEQSNAAKGIQPRINALLLTQRKEMLSADFIDESFSLVEGAVANLISKATKLKMRRVMPLLPCDAAIRHSGASVTDVKSHSFVLFDEDPSINDPSNPTKKRKISDGIITNARRRQSKDGSKLQNDLDVSLVSALHDDTTAAWDGSSWMEYRWVKDYRMEMQTNEHKDCFVFVYNKHLSDEGSSSFPLNMEYYPIDTRIEMKKLNRDESLPHDALVKRDQYSSLFSS